MYHLYENMNGPGEVHAATGNPSTICRLIKESQHPRLEVVYAEQTIWWGKGGDNVTPECLIRGACNINGVDY